MNQQQELLDVRKMLKDLTDLGQFDRKFSFPGREQTHEIQIGTLWEDDLIRVRKRAALQSSDYNVQGEIIVFETLVEAIISIDNYEFRHLTDSDQHDIKKGQLREVLKTASPFTITSLYKKYTEITTQGADAIDQRIEEIKKSSGPSNQEENPPTTIT